MVGLTDVTAGSTFPSLSLDLQSPEGHSPDVHRVQGPCKVKGGLVAQRMLFELAAPQLSTLMATV